MVSGEPSLQPEASIHSATCAANAPMASAAEPVRAIASVSVALKHAAAQSRAATASCSLPSGKWWYSQPLGGPLFSPNAFSQTPAYHRHALSVSVTDTNSPERGLEGK